MTTANSDKLINSEVYVINKTNEGWKVEEDRAIVLDVLKSEKENARMILLSKNGQTSMVNDELVFLKKESAIKEVKFRNEDKFETIVAFAKEYDWRFSKNKNFKEDRISKKFNEVKITITRDGDISMNDDLFKHTLNEEFIKSFIVTLG